ncbi:RusA family crossover junction endodeoxyribonuclease [Bradyrhizobium elkanii]|uniref:Holliday junction resolvase RusA-like endonuclease n=1 Tax=Bradyrhizobium elkanii TaxID=29448 RepID=A0A8I1YF01_BRAEL|nr:RusA family crossover junction endodeoxyribonuclease [Bradyrhizobium elkanii]MBP1297404.1 Holliday junction resolvase RusA-like endonuclease [Bradyrhizobium elkanii]
MSISITLLGAPQGKGRARAFVRGGHVGHYTPEKTRTYEGMIRTAAMLELGSRPPLDEPVEFVLRAVFPVPTSWSQRKRQQAITGDIKPGKKPDLDNIAKAWNDALNGVAYRDDSLICRMTLDKRYGPQPLVVCTVRPMPTFRDQHQIPILSQSATVSQVAKIEEEAQR